MTPGLVERAEAFARRHHHAQLDLQGCLYNRSRMDGVHRLDRDKADRLMRRYEAAHTSLVEAMLADAPNPAT